MSFWFSLFCLHHIRRLNIQQPKRVRDGLLCRGYKTQACVAHIFSLALQHRHRVIERMESIRQVIYILRHHQRTIFIRGLLHCVGKARDLFDELDFMLIQLIIKVTTCW